MKKISILAAFVLYTCILWANMPDTIKALVYVSGCETPNTYIFGEPTTATIRARAPMGFDFLFWSDGCTDNPRTTLFDRDTTITAVFKKQGAVTLKVYADGCSTYNTFFFDSGTSTTISAEAQQYTRFTQWTDGNTDNPRSVTLDRDTSFTAHFAYEMAFIHQNCKRNGLIINLADSICPNHDCEDIREVTVFADGCETPNTVYCANQSTISIIAERAPGFGFMRWSDGNTDNPRQITITSDSTFTAQYAPLIATISSDCAQDTIQCDLSDREHAKTVTLGTNLCDAKNVFHFTEGDTISILAQATGSYYFTGWSDGNSANPRTMVVDQDMEVSAQYDSYQASIWQDCDQDGQTFSIGLPDRSFIDLGTGTLWATDYLSKLYAWGEILPKDEYTWDNYTWAEQGVLGLYALTKYCTSALLGNVDNKTSLDPEDDAATVNWGDDWRMPWAREVIALSTLCTWEKNEEDQYFTVTGPNGNQAIFPYLHLTDSTECLLSTADCSFIDNYKAICLGYSHGAIAPSVVEVFDRAMGMPIRPVYAKEVKQITLRADGCHKTNTIYYANEATISISAVPMEGYAFLRWSDGNMDNPRVVTARQDTSFTAIFIDEQAFLSQYCSNNGYHIDFSTEGATTRTLTLETDGCMTPNTFIVNDSTTLDITVEIHDGYSLKWSDGKTDNPRTITIDRDSTLTAYFTFNEAKVYQDCSKNIPQLSDNQNGKLRTLTLAVEDCPSPSTWQFEEGASISISAIPDDGYNLLWSDGSTASPRSITIYSDTTLTVSFFQPLYNIAHECDSNGINADYNGQRYIDLGLPSGLLWAASNVGASTPEEYGKLFAWGETTTKENYVWSTYRWCDGTDRWMTKYCIQSEYGIPDKKTVLDSTDDAAIQSMGVLWRMPTHEEMQELIDTCRWEMVMHKNVVGYEVTGLNGNVLFLPMIQVEDVGPYASYWTSTLYENGMNQAYCLEIDSTRIHQQYGFRCDGQPIRAVSNATTILTLYADECDTPNNYLLPNNSVATIHAKAKHGFRFKQWTDGNTDNPRQISPDTGDTYTAQFELFIPTDIQNTKDEDYDPRIYTVLGIYVGCDPQVLPPGVYIQNGQKIFLP